jgi:GTP cyclohydrolase I
LLPFHGYVSIGYIPNGKILGLSKLARVVEKIASKPQIQERLTTDILKFIDYLIAPKGTGVQVKATHTCVMWRGVQSSEAEFTTTALSGNFKDNPQTRHEFLMGIAH